MIMQRMEIVNIMQPALSRKREVVIYVSKKVRDVEKDQIFDLGGHHLFHI